jgi:hypothetical protein
MPNLVLAIANHHKSMQTWWRIPEYIKARKAFVKRNPFCVRCGRPTTTPGHSHEDYSSYETYLQAVIDDKCDPLCNPCNGAERKGKKPCPICVKEKSEKIHYIGQDKEYCYDHRPEEEKVRAQQRKEIFKDLVKKSQKINNAKRRAVYQILKEKRK